MATVTTTVAVTSPTSATATATIAVTDAAPPAGSASVTTTIVVTNPPVGDQVWWYFRANAWHPASFYRRGATTWKDTDTGAVTT